MTPYDPSKFSAADSALGYLYQIRVALMWALERIRTGPDFLVSFETLDDVTFETSGGRPDELLQTKHHRERQAQLTDASPDLWKSLRVWFEASEAAVLPSGVALHLLTTATASSGSAASHLRPTQRDAALAHDALSATALTSTNQSNQPAYEVFLRTPETTRRALLDQVVVIDCAPQVTDLTDSLRAEVFWAVERRFQDPFLERLEGWWLRRSLQNLTSGAAGDRILSGELEAQMADLREQFKPDALPVDDDLLHFSLDDATQTQHAHSTFVRQIELTKAGQQRIAIAIRDYYRAFEQRSRWLRDDLLLIGELGTYERRLVEEWEVVFEAMRDELGADAMETLKEKAARDLLTWAERTTIPIRQNVTDPFVTRGSLHMLADEERIGWHLEFHDRLANLLTPAASAP